jgi:magnesium transporter
MSTESGPDLPDHALFETAAAHCSLNVPIVALGQTVGEARQMLIGRRYETASQVVVCDELQFLGIVRIEDLLAAPGEVAVESVMDSDPPVVKPGADQEIATWLAVRHREAALSVVDSDGRFRGVIPPPTLLSVLLSEHEEDLSRLGGFLKSVSTARSSSQEPVGRRFWHRLPWLMAGLGGALLAADLMGSFESQLQHKMMLAFFIPGIVYLADAVGTQTETVVVRGLSVGVPLRHMLRRELLTGLSIGAVLGLLAGPLIWWRWGEADIALCVSLAIFAASSTAAVVALTLPWLLDAFGVDPAFGSGPLATVIQDLLSILIYFVIAMAFS